MIKDDENMYSLFEEIRTTKETLYNVLISNKEKTEGVITFPYSAANGGGEIEISNNTSLPVEVEINGLESLMEENKSFTLNITLPKSSPLSINDLETT